MNNLLKFGLRSCLNKLNNNGKILKSVINGRTVLPAYTRTLWNMCSTSRIDNNFLKPKPASELCHCGCCGLLHTNGEKDLVEFLKGEIEEEKKAQKMKSLPSELDGFKIKSDMAEITFEKKSQLETIVVSMNVNHSVDTEGIRQDGNYSEEMKAKPSFEVDIVRDKKTLSFSCSFVELDENVDPGTTDLFEITEITYFEGDWQDKVYSVAADLLDENLYDLFMTILSEKGITKEFVDSMSDIATSHEHSQYIGLLENLRKFASMN